LTTATSEGAARIGVSPAQAASGPLASGQISPSGDGRGQSPGHADDAAVQRQLADGGPFGQGVRRDHPHGRHHRQGDGQVVVAALLGQVGGRKVGDDPPRGHGQAQAGEGGAHPLAAFGHGLVA
jgi:hypothetical protein